MVVFLQDLRNYTNTMDALSLLAEEQLIQNVVSTMQLVEDNVNIEFENHQQHHPSSTEQAVSSVAREYLQTSACHLMGFITKQRDSSGGGTTLKSNSPDLNKILTVSEKLSNSFGCFQQNLKRWKPGS
jgi:hypothetical protein